MKEGGPRPMGGAKSVGGLAPKGESLGLSALKPSSMDMAGGKSSGMGMPGGFRAFTSMSLPDTPTLSPPIGDKGVSVGVATRHTVPVRLNSQAEHRPKSIPITQYKEPFVDPLGGKSDGMPKSDSILSFMSKPIPDTPVLTGPVNDRTIPKKMALEHTVPLDLPPKTTVLNPTKPVEKPRKVQKAEPTPLRRPEPKLMIVYKQGEKRQTYNLVERYTAATRSLKPNAEILPPTIQQQTEKVRSSLQEEMQRVSLAPTTKTVLEKNPLHTGFLPEKKKTGKKETEIGTGGADISPYLRDEQINRNRLKVLKGIASDMFKKAQAGRRWIARLFAKDESKIPLKVRGSSIATKAPNDLNNEHLRSGILKKVNGHDGSYSQDLEDIAQEIFEEEGQ